MFTAQSKLKFIELRGNISQLVLSNDAEDCQFWDYDFVTKATKVSISGNNVDFLV